MTSPTPARARYKLAIFIGAMIVIAAGGVFLTQYKPPLPEKNMQTPQEAHEATRAAMASTIELLGGPEGWDPFFNASPDRCTVAGVEGVNYTEIQRGPGAASLEERDEAVNRVQEHLNALGMTTWLGERVATDPIVRVLAKDGPTEGFAVYISVDQTTVEGESWCVPGDAGKMILEGQ